MRRFRYIGAVVVLVAGIVRTGFYLAPTAEAYTPTHVAGQDYMICDNPGTYLTSPWTYHALASGSQRYTVAQFEALTGYGTTLPALPSYIAGEDPATEAAVIFAPGSPDVSSPAYDFPMTPLLYFFEGGAYPGLGLDTVSGDEFIGGTAAGYPEPTFDSAGGAGGLDGQNGSYYWSGGDSTLASPAAQNDTTVTTAAAIPGYLQYMTFADGSSYQIINVVGTTYTLATPLASAESGVVWANSTHPIATVSAPVALGGTSLTLGNSTIPLMKYGSLRLGSDHYQLTSVSGSQSGYTIGVAKLDAAVAANTPVYYDDLSGNVTVSYLDIANDDHNTTGTIYTGQGWTVTHNNIHDGHAAAGLGVAFYGGDEGTVEYNCFSKMGDYGANIFGSNNKFDYNEVYESDYQPDPGCGCSGGGKWWGTLNADIDDNAFVNDSPGGSPVVWLDNGNAGTDISGNYFTKSYGVSIHSETGFNLNITNNLIEDSGWEDGYGPDNTNGVGQVVMNSSGGFHIPGSRYDDQVTISGNQFINNWGGVGIWQAGGRTCENSGEGWPDDAGYCSGGFPNNTTVAGGTNYDFSHIGDSLHGFGSTVTQDAAQNSTTVEVEGNEAIDDRIDFADPVKTTTGNTSNVTTLSGATLAVTSTAGFPSTGGLLRVGTSDAWSDGNGSWTGAILSYGSIAGNNFNNVSFVRGSGTLSGPVQQVQRYQVQSQACNANDCVLTITPGLASAVSAGTSVTNAGTCQLFATAAALPSGPLAPNGTSYWDGCQWSSDQIATSGNTFVVQPSVINAGTPLNGGGTVATHHNPDTNSDGCTVANYCGSNFMADQYNSGEAPFTTQIGANAMISNSSLTGCPTWDSGCTPTSDPLKNLNALSNPPGAPAGNGEAAGNDVWSGNSYIGPWSWWAYIYGNCSGGGTFMPTDPSTGKTMPASACNTNFSDWQGDYQQDTGSNNNPLAVTLGGLAANQEIFGPAQTVTAYEDSGTAGNITAHLKVNGATADTATLSSSPHNFSLNTLNYPDGQYTVSVDGTDSGSNAASDSSTVWIGNGDLNGSNAVDLSDLAVLANHWLQTDPSYSDGNITGQSTINLSDLAVMAANWGWSH